MPTTPTSFYQRLVGGETWTDAVNFGAVTHVFGGAVSFTGAPAFTGTPVFGASAVPGCGTTTPVSIAAGTTTLSLTAALHANRIVLVQSSGGLAITPPAATGTGNVYTLIAAATIAGGSLTVDPKAGNASDLAAGVCAMVLSGGTTTSTFPTASNTNFITWNGTTTGGVKGSWLFMADIATNLWYVQIVGLQTSTAATPFSNH